MSGGESHSNATATGKLPPTAPRAFIERPMSSGQGVGQETSIPPTGPSKPSILDNPTIPVGPRAQTQKQQRHGSNTWINPHLKKAPDSPKVMRSQSFAQHQNTAPFRRDGGQADAYADERRPRSSDAKSDSQALDQENRMRSHHSAEPGEITVKSERESHSTRRWVDRDGRPIGSSRDPIDGHGYAKETSPRPLKKQDSRIQEPKEGTKRKRKRPGVPVVRFALPAKITAAGEDSESDDDEEMALYFKVEIEKETSELSKLQAPSLPDEVISRFATLSHGSMVKILNDSEGLTEMLGDAPGKVETTKEDVSTKPSIVEDSAPLERTLTSKPSIFTSNGDDQDTNAVTSQGHDGPDADDQEPQPKTEDMDMDGDTDHALPAPGTNFRGDQTLSRDDAGQQVNPLASAEDKSDEPAVGDASTAQRPPSILLETTEGGSKPPSTPSQVADEEDDDETESEDEAYINIETVRQYMSTPPIEDLPDFGDTAWHKDPGFMASLDPDSIVDNFVVEHLAKFHLSKIADQESDKKIYADDYTHYLDFTTSSDPAAVKSRDKFAVSIPHIEPLPAPPPEPKPEGRGTGRRFHTERDLERVLQASMREDEERRERELRAQKEKYRSDKEAVVPDMFWSEEERQQVQYIDRTGYMPQNRLVSAWHVLPPVNNLTQEESNLFEKRYLELPKQWGKVAEVIPKRDFGTCIQYYYLMKKDLNLKEKLKRQPKRRKKGGRGKQRSSALVSELGNGDPETEENPETGENGERRRPRRAAAPTWNFEQPPIDPDNPGSGQMGRRGVSAAGKGDQPEKVDGRKGGRRKAAKDKDPKLAKPQMLAAAPPAGTGRGRSRSGSRVQNPEFQIAPGPEMPRLPTHLEQPMPSGMQPPFAVQQQQPIMQSQERPQAMPPLSITDVMAAPSLRPEPPPPLPPPKPAMTTFNLAQPQQDRKAPTQASSYWSVSESNDFPQLLRSFGSDWTAIAAHMGSKTAVMASSVTSEHELLTNSNQQVKNYFVRQKDQGKSEWEILTQEADAKRSRGEKRPEPPQPTTGGRGRRYDGTPAPTSRPLAVAPGMEGQGEMMPGKMEAPAQQARPQPFSSYGVAIAQAPTQQPLGQQPIAMQQHHGSQPVSQAMSPTARPLRAPQQAFGFPEIEREPSQQQRVPLPQKAPGISHPESREQRPLASAQSDPNSVWERAKRQERQRDAEMQGMVVKTEADMPPRHYEPFVHRHQLSHGQTPREPLSLARPPSQEPSRSAVSQPYSHQGPPPGRPMQGDISRAGSPPSAVPTSRPISALQQRQSSGSIQEPYGGASSQPATPAPVVPATRPPEPRKTSSIMSLLNDDPPPPPKRVNDMSNTSRPSNTPPPQGMGRPPPGPTPSSQARREPEQYSPYGRTPSAGPSAMPSLKPTYSASPQSQHMGGSRASMGMQVDSPGGERDYYRQHGYPQGHQPSRTDSPQGSHRYPPPGQSGQVPFQSQGGYPTSYGNPAQPPHASSPPPQYSVHSSASRTREVPQGGREPWPPQGHQQPPSNLQQPGGWPAPSSKAAPGPPPQQPWPAQHPSSTSKPPTPSQAWSSAPPPQQPHHMGMRDERGPPIYGSGNSRMSEQQRHAQQQQAQQQQQQQHAMQNRYPTPTSRGPESVPPPAQAYPRYASTPGPGPGPVPPPRDPRDIPARSYTPGGYDGRGPPPPPGPGYPIDPREMQMREARERGEARDPRDRRDPHDAREAMARGLRPHEYDRHPDRYGP